MITIKVITMNISPLRYPGGKGCIAPVVEELINNSMPLITTYYEPFCGGSGVALYLSLLFHSIKECTCNEMFIMYFYQI